MGCPLSRPKRRLISPLGSGTAPSLGNRDPRIRRDRAARSAEVPDPLASSADVAALEVRLAALESATVTSTAAATEPSSEASIALDQGDIVFEDVTYMYATFGVDGAWTSDRWSGDSVDTITGTGTKPVSLSDLQNLAWPTPAP